MKPRKNVSGIHPKSANGKSLFLLILHNVQKSACRSVEQQAFHSFRNQFSLSAEAVSSVSDCDWFLSGSSVTRIRS